MIPAVAADTEPEVLRVLYDVLTAAGWEIHATTGAGEAVDACRRLDPAVLLIGEHVPGGALELLQRVKRDGDLFRISVLMVAQDPDPDAVLAWMHARAEDVLAVPVTPADVLARTFAAHRTKALVVELTAQTNRLQELAFFDELTGLRNRRAILNEVELLLAGARRQDRELSILMLDIDTFKPINDRHGHRAGDEVLREVAKRLAGRLRSADVAGRLGGDELLVVLPDTDAAGAATVAESIRHAVSDAPVVTSAGRLPVTISVGSACWDGEEELQVLLERADQAMYVAKADGRDSVSAA
jgi:two-component system cell cycle response regulator